MTTEINNIKDILTLLPQFKADGHPVNSHWVINLKSNFLDMKNHGFQYTYVEGYFFMKKPFPEFKLNS